MDQSPAVGRLTAWMRERPVAVDVTLAGALVFFTVLLPAASYWDGGYRDGRC